MRIVRELRRNEPWLCTRPDGSGHRLAPELVRLHRPNGEAIGAYSGIGTFGERQVVAASAAIRSTRGRRRRSLRSSAAR